MFISLLLAVRAPSLTRRPPLVVRPGALSSDGIERIGEHALWTAIQTADVVEVTRHFEVAFDEPHVTPVIQTVPDRWPKHSSLGLEEGALLAKGWAGEVLVVSGMRMASVGLLGRGCPSTVAEAGPSCYAFLKNAKLQIIPQRGMHPPFPMV
jgi:hypothetical protein